MEMMVYVFIIRKKVVDCVQQQYLYIMMDGYWGLGIAQKRTHPSLMTV
jgi:hypothetical protein